MSRTRISTASRSSASRLTCATVLPCSAAAKGCRLVFHVAALYRFWARDPAEFYDVNVGGSLNVVDAATAAGVERVVYTSTVGTIGLDGTEQRPRRRTRPTGRGSTISSGSTSSRSTSPSTRCCVRRREGLPVVLVQPTLPLGPGDRAPTPTGKTVLDFLNGRIPGWFDTALNVVDVDDVAAGHLLAAERGAQGRSYVLGGENLELRQILDVLAAATGLPRAAIKVPRRAALAAAPRLGFRRGAPPPPGADASRSKGHAWPRPA